MTHTTPSHGHGHTEHDQAGIAEILELDAEVLAEHTASIVSWLPVGLLVVVEPDGFPRFLPDDAPEDHPGLERRCHEVGDRMRGGRIPHRGTNFGPRLVAAGFSVVGERTVVATIEHSRSESVGHYALAGLGRLRDVVADALSAEDLVALDELLDPNSPHSLLRREDLAVRTERTVWAARA